MSVSDHGSQQSHGSGVLIEGDYVLTCYHILSDRDRSKPIQVTWDGDKKFAFDVAAARPGCDAIVLRPLKGQAIPDAVPRVPLADSEITLGETVYGFGFGSALTNRLRCTGGPVFEFNSNLYHDAVWFAFAGRFRQGDSGGPVFVVRDNKPYIIGIGWGTAMNGTRGHYEVTATRLRVLHRLFGKEKAATNPAGGPRAIITQGKLVPSS